MRSLPTWESQDGTSNIMLLSWQLKLQVRVAITATLFTFHPLCHLTSVLEINMCLAFSDHLYNAGGGKRRNIGANKETGWYHELWWGFWKVQDHPQLHCSQSGETYCNCMLSPVKLLSAKYFLVKLISAKSLRLVLHLPPGGPNKLRRKLQWKSASSLH